MIRKTRVKFPVDDPHLPGCKSVLVMLECVVNNVIFFVFPWNFDYFVIGGE